jgi:hypothetical protein
MCGAWWLRGYSLIFSGMCVNGSSLNELTSKCECNIGSTGSDCTNGFVSDLDLLDSYSQQSVMQGSMISALSAS